MIVYTLPMMQLSASLNDWKLVYRVLHSQLQTAAELIDADVMQRLQSQLQEAARGEGVDVDDHAQWATWLAAASERATTAPLKLVE